MKNYKKALLATMVIAAMPLLAATSNTPINVTTFDDEDGDNLNACSLREALKTAETRKSFGGCEVTDILSTTQKVIQLKAGTYVLNTELTPKVEVSIWGESPVDWQKKSVLTNDYPAQTDLKTTIEVKNNSRIFNTTLANKALALSNIILRNGKTPDRGGAIYAGANVTLQNTKILNSQAGLGGGAIFLAGPTASLSITNSLIQDNQSPIGSVLAMSCFNDNVYSKRDISITGSSLISNGSSSSKSVLDFCGEPKVTLSTNTIAKNIADIAIGNLIQFSGNTKASDTPNNNSSVLSNSSSLELLNNTIVENTVNTALLYDKLGTKLLSFNVLAYNNGSYACRYLLGDAAKQEKVGFNIVYNALSLKGDNKCDVPDQSLSENKTNIDISNTNDIRTLLSPLQNASEYTAFLPLYYPKNNNTQTDLINTGAIGCSSTDQRGIARITDGTLYYDPEARNSCDIGSIELMELTAGDLADLSNGSLLSLIAGYQQEYDFFENLVEKPNNPDFLTYYKIRLQEYKDLLEKTKANLKYRGIYIDLKKYKLPLPQEVELTDGNHQLNFFSAENYKVTVEALGIGQINDTGETVKPDPNLHCEWNEDLEQILVYRTDDVITQAGDKAFCKYTIQSKNDESVKSSGLIQAAFVNMAPLAKDTSVTLKYRQHEKATLNLLSFANDDGDTGEGGKGPDSNPNKPAFWKNADGVELPIRLTNIPNRDLTITADRQGACPEPDDKEICYGGNIYVQEVNTFNPFNFSFNYQVYDADGTASNTATVSVISTATTTDDTRPAGSGGGSTGIFSIFGLLSLLAYRRFRK